MAKQTFTLDHLMNLQRVAGRVPLHLSPNGRYLSVSVKQSQRSSGVAAVDGYTRTGVPGDQAGNCVLVVNTKSGEVIEPFPADKVSWAGIWSPDGSQLAAYVEGEDDVYLTLWNVETRAVRRLPQARTQPYFGFEVPQWTLDGKQVVCKLRPLMVSEKAEFEALDVARPSVQVYSFDPAAVATEPQAGAVSLSGLTDLGVIDIESGAVRRLAQGWEFRMWRLSPDGRAVAVLRLVETVEEQSQHYFDLIVLPLDGSTSCTVASRIPQQFGIGFNLSPDSRYIAYTTNYSNENAGEMSSLWVVPADGSREPLDLAPTGLRVRPHDDAPKWSRDSRFLYSLYGSRLWELTPDGSSRREIVGRVPAPDTTLNSWVQDPLSNVLWTIDSPTTEAASEQSLLAITYSKIDKRWGLARMSVDDSSAGSGYTQMLSTWEHITTDSGFAMAVAADGSSCYLVREASDRAPEIWRVGRDGAGEMRDQSRILTLNPQLDEVSLGTSRLVEFRSANGEMEQGVLVLPPDYVEGRTIPLVVHVYGDGAYSGALHSFGVEYGDSFDHSQLLAGQGYAVLYPNMPMATRDPMRQMPGLVLPAIDRVIEMGIAAPERIGVMGHSYGGYSVLALLVQSQRFRAALSHSGGGFNMTSEYGMLNANGVANTGWCEGDQACLNGTLWEKRDAYIENSPLFYLDRVTTPLLLVVGTDDTVNTAQAGEVFSGLRRLGKRVELRLYKDEGHCTDGWSEGNTRDVCESMLAWFDHYLKTPTDA